MNEDKYWWLGFAPHSDVERSQAAIERCFAEEVAEADAARFQELAEDTTDDKHCDDDSRRT